MNQININFDNNHAMTFYSEYLRKNIMIIISDELEASEEDLTFDFKNKISLFINNISKWYPPVCQGIIDWVKSTYDISINLVDIELMIIYILFEQVENALFGLDFRLSVDIEHGCGVQLSLQNNHYIITKIGSADVAFG